MKKSLFKRISSFVLATAVAASALVTSLTAFAAPESTYTITIEEVPSASATFKAYQIFSGTAVEEDGEILLSNVDWGSGVNGTTLLAALKNKNNWGTDATSTPFDDCTTAQDVAYVLDNMGDDSTSLETFAQIVSGNLGNTSFTATAGAVKSDGTYDYTITGLADGYYIVIDETNTETATDYAKSKPIVHVVGENATVFYKNGIPDINKAITAVNGATTNVSDDGKTSAVGIGDTVTFELKSEIPTYINEYEDGYYFQFLDNLGAGFTLDSDSVKITYTVVGTGKTSENEDATATPVEGVYSKTTTIYDSTSKDTHITVTPGTYSATTGTALTITFNTLSDIISTSVLNGIESEVGVVKNIYLTVTYDATVNENAVIGATGNKNSVKIKYSNDTTNSGSGGSTSTSTEKETTSYAYELDLNKNDGDETLTYLNAGFTITDSGKTAIFADNGNGTYTFVAFATLSDEDTALEDWADENSDLIEAIFGEDAEPTLVAEVFSNGTTGNLKLKGLPVGSYTFKETTTPDGYATVADFTVTIAAAKDATSDDYTGYLDETNTKLGATYENVTIKTTNGNVSGEEATNTNPGVVALNVIDDPQNGLPSTGGSGVYFYYIAGGALVLLAGAALFFTRKKSDKKS